MYFEKEIIIKNSNSHYSCGYHDICPFSPNEKYLVFCSIDSKYLKKNKLFTKNNIFVDINLYELATKKITFLYKTKCYTYEQGVRINWIDNKRITINNLNQNNIPQFVIFNLQIMKIEKTIENYFCHQIAGLDKEKCVSFDYSEIQKQWPSYGFHHGHTKYQPKNSLNIFNWKTNTLLHRFKLEDLESYKNFKDGFIVHPSISENGKKIIFMHRILINDILYSWLYHADLDNLNITLITEEKVSHFTWIGNENFLIFQRLLPKYLKSKRLKNFKSNSKSHKIFELKNKSSKNIKKFKFLNLIRNSLAKLSSGFVIYKVNGKKIKKKLISLNLLGIDCHPFFDKCKNKIYLDSYPNKNNSIGIYSVNLKKPFFAKKEMFFQGDWETNIGKVDAHLRVSGLGNYICIDDIIEKRRSIKILNIRN